jgi:dipeptidyl aminopeptidase/acylaminoacyl peptidase
MSKRNFVIFWACSLISGLLPSLLFAADDRPLIERMFDDVSYGDPGLSDKGFRISPDGQHVAYVRGVSDTRSNLEIWNLETGALAVLEGPQYVGFGDFQWADNEHLAVMILENGTGLLTFYDTNMKKVRGSLPGSLIISGVADPLPQIPNVVAVYVQKTGYVDPRRRRSQQGGNRSDVYLLNFETMKAELLAENPGNIDAWMLDAKGVVRLAAALFSEENRILYRDSNDEDFRPLDLPPEAMPLGFLPGFEKILVATLEDRDNVGVQVFDPIANKADSRVIGKSGLDLVEFGEGWFERGQLRLDQGTGAIIGISYGGKKPSTLWFDPNFRQLQNAVDNLAVGQTNTLLGLTPKNDTIVFFSEADVNPGALIMWNFQKNESKLLFLHLPSVSPDELRPMQVVEFEARDGTTIHGYLTLPKDAEGPFPFITIVHGGPSARDYWEFDPESQYFASLGFAVIKVNFRGSTGFGLTYRSEDNWLNVLRYGVEDVVDGTRWAIEEGIADPERCVVAGASFGGYASMMIPAHEPDLYAVAMPAMGVYDWERMIEFDSTNSHPIVWEILKDNYQELLENPDEFEEWTPVKNADKIEIPMLVLHGRNDPRVDIEQYDAMVGALKRADVDFETYTYTRGGHGFYAARSWAAYYSRQGEFLRKHLDF